MKKTAVHRQQPLASASNDIVEVNHSRRQSQGIGQNDYFVIKYRPTEGKEIEKMSLPDSIKLIRQKKLLNQQEFADALDVGLTTVNRWEVGKSIPNISAMKKIKAYCERYNLSYEIVEEEWLAAKLEVKK